MYSFAARIFFLSYGKGHGRTSWADGSVLYGNFGVIKYRYIHL